MNKKVHIDAQVIELIYFKYKSYVWPFIAFVLSWFIFIQFVLPQVQNFLSLKDTVDANEQTLAQLTQNYNTIASLQEQDIQNNLTIANKALPQVKDFAGILTAISQAAQLSGVAVNDYSFQIGDINLVAQGGGGNQTVQISLTIQGNISQTKAFLTALSQQLPLSEVVSATLSDSSSTSSIVANFFYAPVSKIPFIDTNPFPLLSASQKSLLQTLSQGTLVSVISPTSSISASPVLSGAPISSTSSR